MESCNNHDNTATTFDLQVQLRVIFCGIRDEQSNLRFLRGFEDTILRKIYSYHTLEWASSVLLTLPASCIGCCNSDLFLRESLHFTETLKLPVVSQSPNDYVSFASCGQIEFPPLKNRNVNMMPFVFGQKKSLPSDLQLYFDCIEKCPYHEDEKGNIGYLTVHESHIQAGSAQRREGLHIEQPGVIDTTNTKNSPAFKPGEEHYWGCGVFYSPDEYKGGIFFASNVDNTSAIYNALVDTKQKIGIVDRHGGCEHLRQLIGPPTLLKANELIWMTDRTPHEALVQKKEGVRQFFRVVTSKVSH